MVTRTSYVMAHPLKSDQGGGGARRRPSDDIEIGSMRRQTAARAIKANTGIVLQKSRSCETGPRTSEPTQKGNYPHKA
jgi:hypothetical protein